MDAWIFLTVFAALFQNIRTALQKQLNDDRLSTAGATAVRFIYGLPFIFLYLGFLHFQNSEPLVWFEREPAGVFIFWSLLGGLGQILATAALLKAFRYSTFVVGNTYSKTETLQAALIGLVLIGDALTLPLVLAILISFAGVFLMGLGKERLTFGTLRTMVTNKAAFFGLLSGGGFGVAAVSYRAASLSLGWDSAFLSAGTTLLTVVMMQSIIMLIWLGLRERHQLLIMARAWRTALLTGLMGITASIGWFTAMTLQNAAHVRALGQVELVFSFLISLFWFREKVTPTELAGVLLIVAGLFVLIYA